MYYTASFRYKGPRSNSATSDAAEKALDDAVKIVNDTLNSLDLKHAHQYCWPDGSLYKYIRSDLDVEALKKKLTNAFDNIVSNVRLDILVLADPNEDPAKCDYKTLAEYMAGV